MKRFFYFLLSTLSVVCSGYGQVEPLPVYTSSSLVIQPITPQVFLHTSYLATDKYGKVPCNGILYREGNTTVVFDTPTDNATSEELISWINDELQCQVKAVIVTHFHADCLGGLDTFHKRKIASYAHQHTIALAKEKGSSVPQYGFETSLVMVLENKKVVSSFFGEGHTPDNIVGYIPDESLLFGGCLIKALNATKGNLADANTEAWSATVYNIKEHYPSLKYVVPGHGKMGDTTLLDYTVQLFE